MRATSLATRLGTVTPMPRPYAEPVASVGTLVSKSNFEVSRNEDITTALAVSGFDSIMRPDENELTYVHSVFQSKGFHEIDLVTAESIDSIGRQDFIELNTKLKKFTDSMQGVKSAGLFGLIDDLSKEIQESDIEGIWNKAVNAKPTILAYILSIFDRNAKKKSVGAKLNELGVLLGAKSGSLKDKLQQIENDLVRQKKEQEDSVKVLEAAFEIYYKAFLELRKQFALIVYLEHTYKAQLEAYKAANSGNTDLVINKKLQDYERNFADIQNKRLLLHKSLLQLPITAQQSNNLIGVCKNLIKEVDNTVIISLPSIRSSLVNVNAAIIAQKAMLGNESARALDENLAKLSSKVTADLTVKAELLSSEARLSEANAVASLVGDLRDLQSRMQTAKAQSQANIDNATGILTNATSELKQILGAAN